MLFCIVAFEACSSSMRFSSVRTSSGTPSVTAAQSGGSQQQGVPVPSGTIIRGMASYYGDEFEGRLTSNGEVFSQQLLTAAHKTLPFGTKLKVTNSKTKRSVFVRVNDRGPFVEGRVLDLSRYAAEKLDMVGDGVAPVTIVVME
ncbi:MAG: septal ring lytic transglycosylase RlpA family protein [Candidatus Kapabacteria bacterium]|nr:septal ring lytic transglycosylase RlpA family protein [Candidatus Kapabacteria bacterium]